MALAATVAKTWEERTYKREASVFLLLVWSIITGKLFFWSDVGQIGALGVIYSTATTFVGAFSMAAFGFDAYVKQVQKPAQEAALVQSAVESDTATEIVQTETKTVKETSVGKPDAITETTVGLKTS